MLFEMSLMVCSHTFGNLNCFHCTGSSSILTTNKKKIITANCIVDQRLIEPWSVFADVVALLFNSNNIISSLNQMARNYLKFIV